jgi:hypothetical protein
VTVIELKTLAVALRYRLVGLGALREKQVLKVAAG